MVSKFLFLFLHCAAELLHNHALGGQRLIVATEHVGHGSVIIARTSIYRYLVSLGVVLQSSVPS